MMSMRLIAIVSAFAMGVGSTTTDDFRRVMLNNDDTLHQNCNGMDWEMIDEIILASSSWDKNDESSHRFLGSFLSICFIRCFQYAPGTCPKKDCKGYRRLRSVDTQDMDSGTLSLYCAKVCRGYERGYCPKPGCVGYRRLGSDDAQQDKDVLSPPDFECSAQQLDFISSEFTHLVHTEAITSLCYDTLSDALSIMCEGRN